MQDYSFSKQQWKKTTLIFLVVLLFAYLPVASFLFALKNDAFTGYFPPKFFMSESIHSGHLPLWNPYINFGIPQYADMSSGYWSPFTWTIASTFGYNAYTFTLELLLYILMGGFGFFVLLKLWVKNTQVRTIAALSFMCCGYNIGNLQHFNWISGAAILPWCLWAYHNLLHRFSISNLLAVSLLFYLLISSAHPGISIASAYFFFAFSLFQLVQKKKENNNYSFAIWIKSNALLLLLLFIMSAGMLFAYADILPFFVRANKLTLTDSLLHPTTFTSWISSLLPLTTTKLDAFFGTDISMRNCFFGLTLFVFLILALQNKKNATQKFFLAIGVFFLLLASGGMFKTFAHHYLPFIGFVRLNGEFRIFALISFIVVAAIELDNYISTDAISFSKIKKTILIVSALVFIAVALAAIKILLSKDSILFYADAMAAQQSFASKVKSLLDNLTFWDALAIQGVIQLAFLIMMLKFLRHKKINLLLYLNAANLILISLMNLPFTGVGKASVRDVQNILERFPKGISIPSLQPINKIDTLPSFEKALIGDGSFYNKNIGVIHEAAYPIRLNATANKFQKIESGKSDSLMLKPFLFFLPENEKQSIVWKDFSPNKIAFEVNAAEDALVVLQQSHYPHWICSVNHQEKKIEKFDEAFMCVQVNKGKNLVEFTFNPIRIKAMMIFSLVVFASSLLILAFTHSKSTSLS